MSRPLADQPRARLLLKNARLIDPANGIDTRGDLGVVDGRLVNPEAAGSQAQVLDLDGKAVLPGFVDLHVHFREPGFEYKEDLETGTHCAAAGGFTTVVLMPNTQPAIDRPAVIDDLRDRIRRKARVRCLFSACMSVERRGQALSEMTQLASLPDVVAFSDDGNCIQQLDLMQAASRIAAEVDLPILDHCEDEGEMAGGIMRRSPTSERLEVPGMPGETESNIVRRNAELARQSGARFHCQHISYKTSVELLRQAQAEGLSITAEAAPHHLTLTVEEVPILGTNAKMNPPLGTREDRDALYQALADDVISVIATDHAPHSPAEKANSLVDAPFGIIGLETAFAICYTELVLRHGVLTLPQLVAKLTCNPAGIIRDETGTLSPGARADLAIVDLDSNYMIDITRSLSKSVNSPFHQRQVSGRILGTLCGGSWAYQAPSFP